MAIREGLFWYAVLSNLTFLGPVANLTIIFQFMAFFKITSATNEAVIIITRRAVSAEDENSWKLRKMWKLKTETSQFKEYINDIQWLSLHEVNESSLTSLKSESILRQNADATEVSNVT